MCVFELKGWAMSSYNEGDVDQIDFYINEAACAVGDKAYMYSHEECEFTELRIVHIISRAADSELYDRLIERDDVLLEIEAAYGADTSAEFITDNDCYLVWFDYM